MCARVGAAILGVALGPLLAGCGGHTVSSGGFASDSGSGAAVSQGGGSATDGSAAAVGGSAARADAGSSSAGGVAASARGCPGGYDLPQLLFDEEPLFYLRGPSVTADELQIFYVQGVSANAGVEQTVVFRTRESQSEPFGPVQSLPELADVCPPVQNMSPDVTGDGLTLYVSCTGIHSNERGTRLRVARRLTASGAFVLEPELVGNLSASASLSADELTAYGDGEIGDTAPQLFLRGSTSEVFGPAQPVPGFTMPLNSPDISADGLTLFGSAWPYGGEHRLLRRASRPSIADDFGPPEDLDLGMPDLQTTAPNVAPSCNLYFLAKGVQFARYRQPL